MTPYMVGKFAPNSSHFTRGLVKYVPGRGCFRAVPSQNGDKFVTSPPPPFVERLNYLAAMVQAAKVEFPIVAVLSLRPCLTYAPPENETISGYIV